MVDAPSFIMPLAFECLQEACEYYNTHKKFSHNHLENLYDFFGNVLEGAAEILEKSNIIKYEADNGARNVYKVGKSTNQYTVFEDINYCHCPLFQNQVLELRNLVTCKHVLAVVFGKLLGKVTQHRVNGFQMQDFLNLQLEYVLQ